MHSKIIDPKRDGRFIFHNQGSCKKTVTYLGHEARAQDKSSIFFNGKRTDILAEEVQKTIDNNTKGLRKHQEKFYSLVISPSDDELSHIDGKQEKLQQYTRTVMENYATNFHLKDGKKLNSKNLVWFATIHQNRKIKDGDHKGQTKTGLHQHIHILVSAKDKSAQYRLNPKGRKYTFHFKSWQIQNGKSFQRMFDYEKPTLSEKLTQGLPQEKIDKYQERIRYKVGNLNEHFLGKNKLDVEKVLSIGKTQSYGKGFFFNLHRLTQHYKQGKLVHNPYHVLKEGKDEKVLVPEVKLTSFAKSVQQLGYEIGGENEMDFKRKKKRGQEIER